MSCLKSASVLKGNCKQWKFALGKMSAEELAGGCKVLDSLGKFGLIYLIVINLGKLRSQEGLVM